MKSIKNIILLIVFILPGALSAKQLLNAADVVPEILALGIRAQVEKLTDPRLQNLRNSEDKYFLNIKLGRLSAQQFAQLQRLYGRKNFTTYQANRDYNLIDFLPASMQAVVNQVFTPVHYSFDFLNQPPYDRVLDDPKNEGDAMDIEALSKNSMSSQTNCWNTTIENLNFLHFGTLNSTSTYNLYLPGRWQADEALKSDQSSTLVAAGTEKVYDALLISLVSAGVEGDPGILQHSAILLGSKLVFEKTDSQDHDPYRLALRADVLAKYTRLLESEMKLEYRRYGKKQIEASGARTEVSPLLREILEKGMNKPLSSTAIGVGCETGFGGGCDYYLFEKLSARVMKSPRSERGILLAPQSVLRRFEGLRGM